MDKSVQEIYGNRLRVRVCGLCWQDEKLLLVNHSGLRKGSFWAPPGGGMEFGSSAPENLEREFKEETGLSVAVGKLAFVTEFLRPPLHAIEVFYEVALKGGTLGRGIDPEASAENQLIREVRFMTISEIDRLPGEAKHGAFGMVKSSGEIRSLNGYFMI